MNVVDGAIYNGSLRDINPVDIETVEILKDASSAAVYGAKAASGVILITSTKGRRGKPTINYSSRIGTTYPTEARRPYSPEEYVQWDLHRWQNKTFVLSPNTRLPVGGEADWYIFRLAETYLLRAEAHYWNGDVGSAAQDINTVRGRANAPLITASDVTIEYIFDERARELYMEEPRHSEMVRASYIMAAEGREGYSLDNFSQSNWYYDRVMEVNDNYHQPAPIWRGSVSHFDPHHVLLPVPHSVIEANTQGRVNQNEGYDRWQNNVAPITTIE